MDRFRRKAGKGWGYLAEAIPAGAVPNHAFHVFGVYPWVGLLQTKRFETPLEHLDKCRVRWGQVVSTDGDQVTVLSRPLTYDGHDIGLGERRLETARRSVDGVGFLDPFRPGDWVSLHWGWVVRPTEPAPAPSAPPLDAPPVRDHEQARGPQRGARGDREPGLIPTRPSAPHRDRDRTGGDAPAGSMTAPARASVEAGFPAAAVPDDVRFATRSTTMSPASPGDRARPPCRGVRARFAHRDRASQSPARCRPPGRLHLAALVAAACSSGATPCAVGAISVASPSRRRRGVDGPSAPASPSGTITLYTSVTQATVDAVVGGWKAANPGVDGRGLPGADRRGGGPDRDRSPGAGSIRADVLWLSDPLSIAGYADQGLLQAWTPPSAAAIDAGLPDRHVLRDAAPEHGHVKGAAVAPRPGRLEGLLGPADVKGKVALPDPGFAGTGVRRARLLQPGERLRDALLPIAEGQRRNPGEGAR